MLNTCTLRILILRALVMTEAGAHNSPVVWVGSSTFRDENAIRVCHAFQASFLARVKTSATPSDKLASRERVCTDTSTSNNMGLLPFLGSGKKANARRGAPVAGQKSSGAGGLSLPFGSGASVGGGGSHTAGSRLQPGVPLPTWILDTVQGGKLQIGAPTGNWMLVVVYRGKHDPVSRNYLSALLHIAPELDAMGVEVVAVSGDPRERAEAFVETLKATSAGKAVSYKIAYGLPTHVMKEWGLYVSTPRSHRETDRPFPEPALFVVNPQGNLHIVDYSNSPFARPDIRILVEGIRYIQENDYPVRGTHGFEEE